MELLFECAGLGGSGCRGAEAFSGSAVLGAGEAGGREVLPLTDFSGRGVLPAEGPGSGVLLAEGVFGRLVR